MRTFFRIFSGVLLIAAAGVAFGQSPADYATVRARLRAAQTGGDALNATDPILAAKVTALNTTAQTHWTNLNKSATRTSLWSDLTISATRSDSITPNYERLRTLAAAYAANGAALKGNAALRDDIVSALQWLATNHYNPNRRFYDNWFPWHLAVPLNLVDIFACLHDGLSPAVRGPLYTAYATAVDFYQSTAGATFANTGANRVWRARIDVGLGAALENTTRLSGGRDKLSVVLPYVTSGDGFYTDGSFIQHNTHSYTGGYGLYLIAELSAVLEAVAGTPWIVTDPNLANVFRWVDEAYAPVLFRGAIMDHTRGREISRAGSTDHSAGHPTLTALARVAQFADPADATRFRSLVKGHLRSDAFRNYLNSANLSAAGLVKPLLDDSSLPAAPALMGCYVFSGMDRVVHHRGTWAYAVSLSSKRISKYESINAENLRGWHLGDGAAYLYTGDLGQYADQYWPTANPYRLAGITVDARLRANAGTNSPNTIDPRTTKAWVGGSTVLGEFGAAGMDHEAAQSDLRAKKSWFFFDQEVVHLGTGIATSAGNANRIETIVEHRLLGAAGNAGPVTFTANGTPRAATPGATESLAAVTHAHLAVPLQAAYGNGDIGYVFPAAPPLHVLRESRSGSYNDINQGPFTNSTVQTRSYLTLWFDHGTQLAGAGADYAYVILPGASAARTAAYAQNSDIEILANTSLVQAVRDGPLKATGINFWAAADVAGITCDRAASLMLLERDGQLHLGLSDPTQESVIPVTLELPYAAESFVSKDPLVTVDALAPRLRLQFGVAGTRGRSLAASFKLAGSPEPVGRRPVVTLQPVGITAAVGTGVTLTVAASGEPTIQWRKNGVNLAGATAGTLTFNALTAEDTASYDAVLTNTAGTEFSSSAVVIATAPLTARLRNLSVRTTLAAEQILIVGLTMAGGTKDVLLRAAGPGLAALGVPGAMEDPRLAVFTTGAVAVRSAENNNWEGNAAVRAANAALGAFPFPSDASLDAALVTPIAGGRTVQVSGPTGGGVIVEVYEHGAGNAVRFTSLSARNLVGTGANLLFVGITVEGSGTKNVLVRAAGPSLGALGVPNTLVDPKLELFTTATPAVKIAENDTYAAALAPIFRSLGAFDFLPGAKDAALVLSLAAGSYTVQVSGVNNGTGEAIVEVYELP
jgi:hyaluronate lyase